MYRYAVGIFQHAYCWKGCVGVYAAMLVVRIVSVQAQTPGPLAAALTPVATVSDTKALGYTTNQRLLIDTDETAYFTVRTRDCGRPCRNQFNIALFQSTPNGYDHLWLVDDQVSHPAQRPAAIALVGSEVQVVWYGGQKAYPQPTAHQIQFARVQRGTPMTIIERVTPFYVTGYEVVYPRPSNSDLWQEHPAVVVDADGNLHVVWEARDQSCRDPVTSKPVPRIAYAQRTAATGHWSVRGTLDRPPYLLPDVCQATSRPIPLLDAAGALHVVAYGAVGGIPGPRVLYGHLAAGTFSGWTQVAASANHVNQKNVSAVLDATGTIHVAWRKGPDLGLTDCLCAVVIKYSRRDPTSGVWSAPVVVSNPAHHASTPSIAVHGATVHLAYVGWVPGLTNRASMVDNGYPNDTSTVAGALYVADNALGSWVEHSVGAADRISAYPTWQHDANQLLWTSATSTCIDSSTQATDCVRVQRGAYVAGAIK